MADLIFVNTSDDSVTRVTGVSSPYDASALGLADGTYEVGLLSATDMVISSGPTLTPVFSDDFNSYANDTELPSQANWQSFAGSPLEVWSQRCTNVTQGTARRAFGTATLSNDQYVQVDVTIDAGGTTGVVAAIARASSNDDGYEATLNISGAITLRKRTGGGGSTELGAGTVTLSGNNTLQVRCVGTTITAWHNGTQALSATDSDYTGGDGGIRIFRGGADTASHKADNYVSGNVS